MIRTTGDYFYLLMYQRYDGVNDWWGLFDSLEAAVEDGPWCYENQIEEPPTLEQRTEITKKLFEDLKYSDESGDLTLWIDTMALCTNKEE